MESCASASRAPSIATRTSGSCPPITTTSLMPGTASKRYRRSNSANSRNSKSEHRVASAVRATNRISPVTDTTGAISACASSGNSACTRERRSKTSKRAWLKGTAQSKSTHTKERPPLELERIVRTPGIPFTEDSIGIVTNCSTSSAVNPPASV